MERISIGCRNQRKWVKQTNEVNYYAKGSTKKRYIAECKKTVIETMIEEKLSYSETVRIYEINDYKRIYSQGTDLPN